MIIPLYKPYGGSSHLLAQKMGLLLNEKATHTGTLDPAAEGVLVVLTGQDRYKKQELSSVSKEYEAQILLGISTDTHDLIGLPTAISSNNISISKETIDHALSQFVGSFVQPQPLFSAQRIAGESAFDLAKKNHTFKPRENKIDIHSVRLITLTSISLKELRSYNSTFLGKINGDFRQAEIEHSWTETYNYCEKQSLHTFPLATVRIKCSKRTYIRSLVRDLSEKLGIPATLFSLVRTQNGPYTIKDCLCLIPDV